MTTIASTIKPDSPATIIELRGESGKLYGTLNTATGVIHIRRGNERDRVDVSAYLKAAGIKKDAV